MTREELSHHIFEATKIDRNILMMCEIMSLIDSYVEEQTKYYDLKVRKISNLKALLKKASEALTWCGGSPDFTPEGQARIGWERIVIPILNEIQGLK